MSETAVITGANRGFGLELARALSERGATVIAGCRTPSTATELAEVASAVLELDVGDEASIDRFAGAVAAELDGAPLDVLVNNAGIDARNLGAADSERDVLVQRPDHVLGQVNVNAVGPMLLSRKLLDHLRRSPRPRIVNVSSQVGSMEVAATVGRDVGYTVSKAALNMVTVKLAQRLTDDGVTVIALHPGHLRTAMGGAAAPMEPAEAAGSVASLIAGLTPADSGTFRRWDGSIHPW